MLDSLTAQELIKPHMPVVCSEDGQFATVDHVEGRDLIKLTRDATGKHHVGQAWNGAPVGPQRRQHPGEGEARAE